MGIFDKFKLGLNKSSKSLSSGLNDLIFKRKIDENMLNELEDFLIQSDVGVESAKELREKFANTKVNPKTSEKDEIYKIFLTFLNIISPKRPVIVSIAPIIIKSNKDQLTSFVNCIAINGIKSIVPTIYKILIIISKSK